MLESLNLKRREYVIVSRSNGMIRNGIWFERDYCSMKKKEKRRSILFPSNLFFFFPSSLSSHSTIIVIFPAHPEASLLLRPHLHVLSGKRAPPTLPPK